jgi:hypothetical protein
MSDEKPSLGIVLESGMYAAVVSDDPDAVNEAVDIVVINKPTVPGGTAAIDDLGLQTIARKDAMADDDQPQIDAARVFAESSEDVGMTVVCIFSALDDDDEAAADADDTPIDDD